MQWKAGVVNHPKLFWAVAETHFGTLDVAGWYNVEQPAARPMDFAVATVSGAKFNLNSSLRTLSVKCPLNLGPITGFTLHVDYKLLLFKQS